MFSKQIGGYPLVAPLLEYRQLHLAGFSGYSVPPCLLQTVPSWRWVVFLLGHVAPQSVLSNYLLSIHVSLYKVIASSLARMRISGYLSRFGLLTHFRFAKCVCYKVAIVYVSKDARLYLGRVNRSCAHCACEDCSINTIGSVWLIENVFTASTRNRPPLIQQLWLPKLQINEFLLAVR